MKNESEVIKEQRDALLACVKMLRCTALEAMRNAPDCDTIAADHVYNETERALIACRALITSLCDADLPERFQASAMYGIRDEAERQRRICQFKKYCADNSIYYYARSREEFFQYQAFELAAEAGCTKVLLEDMS